MTNQEREILSGALVEVCAEMLSGHGKQLEESAAAADVAAHERTLVASVGLSGQDVKGALVVMGGPEFFRSIYPAELARGTIAEDDLADWAGEMANQIVGRLKNRFCRRGLDFSISTPTVIRGVRLQVCGGEQSSGIHRTLAVAGQAVDVYFQVARKDDQALLRDEESAATASAEGETLLF